jgi:hypothetical protein
MSDTSRPGYRAQRAIVEYAAHYAGPNVSLVRVRELVRDAAREVYESTLGHDALVEEVLDELTRSDA